MCHVRENVVNKGAYSLPTQAVRCPYQAQAKSVRQRLVVEGGAVLQAIMVGMDVDAKNPGGCASQGKV